MVKPKKEEVVRFAPEPDTNLIERTSEELTMKKIRSVEKRYHTARFIAELSRSVGFIIAIAGPVIFTMNRLGYSFAGLIEPTDIKISLWLFLITPLIGVPLMVHGELVKIAVEMEHNTRATVKALRDLPGLLRRFDHESVRPT